MTLSWRSYIDALSAFCVFCGQRVYSKARRCREQEHESVCVCHMLSLAIITTLEMGFVRGVYMEPDMAGAFCIERPVQVPPACM